MKFTLAMLGAIIAAFIVGAFTPETSWLITVYDLIGTLFINALKMIVIPLVMTAIIKSLMEISVKESLGALGAKTALFYTFTTFMACATGLLVINWIKPGIINGIPGADALGLPGVGAETLEKVTGHSGGEFLNTITNIIPPNLIEAAATNQILGLIFFSILVGVFLRKMSTPAAESLKSGISGFYELILSITNAIIYLAPIGVFALIAEVAATTGLSSIKPMLVFMGAVMLALGLHAFVTLILTIRLIARRSGIRHLSAMTPALLTAFSTASSSATLPVSLRCVQERSYVSKRVSSLVLPLGATINMDGTALYECAAVLFIAQAYGLDLTLAQQVLVVFLSLATSFGVAGVPAASLVAITLILGTLGLPAEAIGLIMVTDRLLDMLRTAVNIWGDSVGAVVLARLEGEEEVLSRPPEDFELGTTA